MSEMSSMPSVWRSRRVSAFLDQMNVCLDNRSNFSEAFVSRNRCLFLRIVVPNMI